MPEILSHLLNVVAPIAVCVLVGAGLARFAVPFDHRMIGKLVQLVGFPALIVQHLAAGHVAIGIFLKMLAVAWALIGCAFLISAIFLAVTRLPFRAFIPSLSVTNVGSVGVPVAALALGPEGLAYSFAFMVATLIFGFTFGEWLPKGSVSFRDLLKAPVIYALILSLVLLGTGTKLPGPADAALTILGGIAVPLMLLTLGHSLATLHADDLRLGALLAGFHLATGLVAGFALATALGLGGTERSVLILMAIMPMGLVTYLFVELHQPALAPRLAGAILVSTLLTVIALPLVLTYGL